MRKIFEEIIKDYQAAGLCSLTRRELAVPDLPKSLNKALAFIGMRRSGKTYLMFQIQQDLASQGIARSRMIYVNFEDDRLGPVPSDTLRLITDVHAELFPETLAGPRYLFLDEIQLVQGWERFVRRLIDTENIRVYLTGSSSKMLSREVASALRGRSLTIEVSPFCFREFLRHEGQDLPDLPGSRDVARLKHRFKDYLVCGGFPETVGLDEALRIKILQEYVAVAVQRDICERHGVHNPEPLRVLIRAMLENAGALFSVNKAYNSFKSQGRSVSKDSMYRFLDHVQDAFLLFAVEMANPSKNVRATNPKKIYAVDPGLVTAFSWKFARNTGALLENTVYCELRRRFDQIHYYRTASGREVDFCCTDSQGKVALFQVCADISATDTMARETQALFEAMAELDLTEGVLVTLDEDRAMEKGNRTIHVVAAYAWVLGGTG